MNQQQPGLFVQKRKTGLFGRQKTEPAVQPGILADINSLNSRIRILEERLNNLNRKFEVNESNDLANQKRVNIELKTTNSEIDELKHPIEEIKEKIEIITREIPNLASRDELEVLKKYIDMWEPLNFVTRDELDKLLKEKNKV